MKSIKPSKEERAKFEKAAVAFLKKLNSKLKDAEAILGGSSAKDTWLPDSHDIDVFVAYNYEIHLKKSAKLSDLLEPILDKLFKNIDRVHGSRDYFQIPYQNYVFEVVPILKIKKAAEAINLTDVSPLHTIWVNKQAKKLKDEIRKSKAFFKANKLYGAESYINGFSGYVLEILTVYYGSFIKLLQASLKWKEKAVIDVANYYKIKMVFYEINKSKLLSPIIVVDPVDKSRNAAAALSSAKLKELKKLAKNYLNNPGDSFFTKDEISLDKVKLLAKKNSLVYLTITSKEGKRDVVGARLLKAFNFLKRELSPFSIKQADWELDQETIFYFILAKQELPKEQLRLGPPLKFKDFVKDFKKKNKNTFTKNGKIYAKVKIPYPKLQYFVKNLLKKKYFREKILTVKLDLVI